MCSALTDRSWRGAIALFASLLRRIALFLLQAHLSKMEKAPRKAKKRIHVNQHVIRANNASGKRDPVFTIKTYKENFKANHVEISGPCVLIYRPDDPLSCGARCWIETDSLVRADGTEL